LIIIGAVLLFFCYLSLSYSLINSHFTEYDGFALIKTHYFHF